MKYLNFLNNRIFYYFIMGVILAICFYIPSNMLISGGSVLGDVRFNGVYMNNDGKIYIVDGESLKLYNKDFKEESLDYSVKKVKDIGNKRIFYCTDNLKEFKIILDGEGNLNITRTFDKMFLLNKFVEIM